MFFKNLCILVLWTKVALALEGLNISTSSFLGVQPLILSHPLKYCYEHISWGSNPHFIAPSVTL